MVRLAVIHSDKELEEYKRILEELDSLERPSSAEIDTAENQ
jgi:hypothetical protein